MNRSPKRGEKTLRSVRRALPRHGDAEKEGNTTPPTWNAGAVQGGCSFFFLFFGGGHVHTPRCASTPPGGVGRGGGARRPVQAANGAALPFPAASVVAVARVGPYRRLTALRFVSRRRRSWRWRAHQQLGSDQSFQKGAHERPETPPLWTQCCCETARGYNDPQPVFRP